MPDYLRKQIACLFKRAAPKSRHLGLSPVGIKKAILRQKTNPKSKFRPDSYLDPKSRPAPPQLFHHRFIPCRFKFRTLFPAGEYGFVG